MKKHLLNPVAHLVIALINFIIMFILVRVFPDMVGTTGMYLMMIPFFSVLVFYTFKWLLIPIFYFFGK